MSTFATLEEAQAAAKARSAEMLETWETVDFDGKNCDNPCDGWDGNDRRCECGNRRVSWAFSLLQSDRWVFYAEAY